MNSDTYATSRYVNAIVPQLRLVACLKVMLDSHPALESATPLGPCPGRSTVTWSLRRSNGGQMVGQIVGQIDGQIIKCSTNYAPAAEIPVTGNCGTHAVRGARKGEK
ncbi:hypothetical protein ES703_54885 [subsurface metagenome]